MPEDQEHKRRGEDLTVDNTKRITTTLGFLFSAGAALWIDLAWTDRVDDQAVEVRSEIQALRVIVEDVASRQGKYIERNAVTHALDEAEDDELHHVIMSLREYLAARYGETLP